MKRPAWIVSAVAVNAVLLAFRAWVCGHSPQAPSVQHLGDSLVEWETSYFPPPQKKDLDSTWSVLPGGAVSDIVVFVAPLPGAVASFEGEIRAAATWNGESVPVQPYRDTASLRTGTIFIEAGKKLRTAFGVLLKSNGSTSRTVELREGQAHFDVFAKGDPALGEPPKMEVFLNGSLIGESDVNARTTAEVHSVTGAARDGFNTLEVAFINDLYRPPEDRNLYVEEARTFQPARVFVLGEREDQPPRGIEIEYRPFPILAEEYWGLEPAPGLADGPGPWRYYQLRHETVPAIPLPPPGATRFPVRLGGPSALSVAYGVLSATDGPARESVVFETHVRKQGELSMVDRLEVTPKTSYAREARWVRRSLNLDALGAGEAELVITSRRKEVEPGGDESRPLVLLAEPVLSASPVARPRLPNVLLVSIDTLRADHLGCYGYERPTSPVLDGFARDGILFETVVAQSSWTLPSHVSMLSSLFVSTHGLMRRSDSVRRIEMLASILKREGFRTKAITDGGFVAAEYGFPLGFESYESHGYQGFAAIIPSAEEWLRDHADAPFFLFLHTYDVHHPWRPPSRFQERLPPPATGSSPPSHMELARPVRHFDQLTDPEQWKADLQYVIGLYDACIMYVDEEMGRLFSLLKELGLWEDTVVIVTSDHGEEFFEHGRLLHRHALYDETTLVPLMVHAPGINEGTRVGGLAQVLDIPPTVLDLLGIEYEGMFQGQSLLTRLDGVSNGPPAAYSELEELIARRTLTEKVIHQTRKNQTEIYDLANDAGEKRDLTKEGEERPSSLKELLEFRERNRALGATQGAAATVELSEELEESLRRLGYVDR